jgi:hypothetical protein
VFKMEEEQQQEIEALESIYDEVSQNGFKF